MHMRRRHHYMHIQLSTSIWNASLDSMGSCLSHIRGHVHCMPAVHILSPPQSWMMTLLCNTLQTTVNWFHAQHDTTRHPSDEPCTAELST